MSCATPTYCRRYFRTTLRAFDGIMSKTVRPTPLNLSRMENGSPPRQHTNHAPQPYLCFASSGTCFQLGSSLCKLAFRMLSTFSSRMVTCTCNPPICDTRFPYGPSLNCCVKRLFIALYANPRPCNYRAPLTPSHYYIIGLVTRRMQ